MPSSAALSGPALREAKRTLRAAVIDARDRLPPPLRGDASRRIATRILALPQWRAARTVLLTLPFRSEWDAARVAHAALGEGKHVLMPRVDAPARVLGLHRITSLAVDVVPGYRGIPEPRDALPLASTDEVDFVLVPGVAFDAHGGRLGYGGGYYDRLLPLLPREAARVAGAFDEQIVPHVPSAGHDLRVDVIVTPTRLIAAPR